MNYVGTRFGPWGWARRGLGKRTGRVSVIDTVILVGENGMTSVRLTRAAGEADVETSNRD